MSQPIAPADVGSQVAKHGGLPASKLPSEALAALGLAGKADQAKEPKTALPAPPLREDLKLRGFPRAKVVAIVVAVMADTLVRIGNAGYARQNKSYGLTTLRNRHVQFLRGGHAQLKFRGKGGIDHEVSLDDARLTRLVRDCQQLPGQHLFQYRDDDGAVQPVDSGLVNDYLRDAMGEAFTAKDFRTWGGTLAAIRLLAEMPWDEAGASQRAMASMRKSVEVAVSRQLGNTPAVCRKSYIDPRVYAAWESGWLAKASEGVRGPRQWEALALRTLRRRPDGRRGG